VLGRLDLRLNADKMRVVDLGQHGQGFDFLGYTHRVNRKGRGRYRQHRWPGAKAGRRMTAQTKAILLISRLPSNPCLVAGILNSVLRGWGAYFRWGESHAVFGRIDSYIRRQFALCLASRYGRMGTGWKWRRPDGTWMTIYRFLNTLGCISCAASSGATGWRRQRNRDTASVRRVRENRFHGATRGAGADAGPHPRDGPPSRPRDDRAARGPAPLLRLRGGPPPRRLWLRRGRLEARSPGPIHRLDPRRPRGSPAAGGQPAPLPHLPLDLCAGTRLAPPGPPRPPAAPRLDRPPP
jgi:hypothetical protein